MYMHVRMFGFICTSMCVCTCVCTSVCVYVYVCVRVINVCACLQDGKQTCNGHVDEHMDRQKD